MRLIILAVFALISLAAAADNRWYKTCENSSFCQRCRKVSGASSFEVLKETLYTETTFVSVEVRNKQNQHLFLMKLRAIKVCSVIQSLKFKCFNGKFSV
jgi:hypothetical protein